MVKEKSLDSSLGASSALLQPDLPYFACLDWISRSSEPRQPPLAPLFLTGPKLAVYVLEYLASNDGGQPPRSFIICKFFPSFIDAWAHVVDVEKLPGHVLEMQNGRGRFLSAGL